MGTFLFQYYIDFGARSGVIIDQCKAHGIWLDEGELKHLMEWRKAGGKLLHEKREIENQQREQREKERREREQKRWIARANQQSGSGTGGFYFSPHRQERDVIDLVSDVVFNLFR